MAKSHAFFGLRRGSTKSHTYQVVKGQQITKDRVYEVTNPKSDRQMFQRARFANMVKFYKHSIQAFFKFAFEDKKQTESEYNAFMRHNMSASLVFVKEAVDSKTFPAFGSEWMLTQGSLPNLDVRFITEYVEEVKTEWPVVVLPYASGDITTMGALSSALINGYGLQEQDIITLVYVRTNCEDIDDIDPIGAPNWDIKQFRLDESAEETIAEVLGASVKVATHDGVGVCLELGYNPDPLYAMGATAVVSRVAPSGTYVSDSYLRNNGVAQSIANSSKVESYISGALTTWGATGEAILQGSLVQ